MPDNYNHDVRTRPDVFLPIISVNRNTSSPLYTQVYNEYRAAILRGDLRPGQQIPSSRDLASEIKVSRFPVLQAYAQLQAEGYFECKVGSGTFISSSLPEQLISVVRPKAVLKETPLGPRPVSQHARLLTAFPPPAALRHWGSFGVHQPGLDEFPFSVWSRLVAHHSRNPNVKVIQRVDPMGLERFRGEICNYLRTARGVKCNPDQVMVVSGSQQAIDITARALLGPSSKVFVEEPGYILARSVLAAAGCRLIGVPVDREGMNIAQGARRHKNIQAAVVTSSHQFPMGYTMSATRRIQLLNWAQSSGAWVIEDDYDSEYRYDSKPIASLQGLDVNERVIYIGTFSKVLFPSLRVGYMVIPRDLVAHFMAVRFTMDIFPPYLYQEVLADFMRQGHFGRHIRKMRQLYGERRRVLIESIREEFGDRLEIHGADAGMHVTITLPDGCDDQNIVDQAARERIWLWRLSPSYFGKHPRQGLILGFGSISAAQIPRAVRHLHSVVRDAFKSN